MIRHLLSAAAVAALIAAGPAQALALVGSGGSAGSLTDYSEEGLLSFDADFTGTAGRIVATYAIEAGDLLAPLDFNALLRNFTGEGLGGYVLSLSAGQFGGAGTVTRQFGGSTAVAGLGSGMLTLDFDTPEFVDVEVGDVLGTPGAANWLVDFGGLGLQVGDRVRVAVSAVPEPGTLVLAATVLGIALLGRRRRR
jgi:hypothetical protein